ncbi:hypothetical protein [uncultured Desulfobacter sp.]|uniref:hypothetical protein n=1 Tax=uncultured Desulfobacter sp. TaxID=240139 RepID=UPI002AAB9646|nr:hypothetical protein [uncultured Desulfobacter sp.]
MIFGTILNSKQDDRGIITHQVLKDSKESKNNYAQVAAGLHWPEKGSPGFSVILGEIFNPYKDSGEYVRGPLVLLAETEYQESLSTMFSKLSDELGHIGCTDIFCDSQSTGRREFAEAFWDFKHQNIQVKGSLCMPPFPENFGVGFHEIRHQIETGLLEIPKESICFQQLQKIIFDDLRDPMVHAKFPALEALRFAAGGIMNRTPKPYRKKRKRRQRSAMAL